jgi:TonB family protein
MAEPLQKEREELKFRVTDQETTAQNDHADPGVETKMTTPYPSATDAEQVNPTPADQPVAAASLESQSPAGLQADSASPSPSSPASSAPSATPAASSDPADLMDIITNPHASEAEWVSACHQLDKHEQRKAGKEKKQPVSKRAIGIVSTLILGATVGASAIFHWGPFAEPKINYGPYMTAVQQDIKSHWHPPTSTQGSTVAIHFKVHKNGELTDVGFDRLSRLSEVDAAALKSVIESMPALPPLPEGAPESVDVEFHFDYNVTPKDKDKVPADKP